MPFAFTGKLGKITIDLGRVERLAGGYQGDDGRTGEVAGSLMPGVLALPARLTRRAGCRPDAVDPSTLRMMALGRGWNTVLRSRGSTRHGDQARLNTASVTRGFPPC